MFLYAILLSFLQISKPFPRKNKIKISVEIIASIMCIEMHRLAKQMP